MSFWRKYAIAAVAMGCMIVGTASAADIKYDDLFKTRALKCIHPTLNVDKATVEILKGPTTAGDVTTVRVKAYYEGWMKKNVMESDLMIRQAGSIRQLSVKVLSDSGSPHKACELENGWKDF
jgi:hypothetical protein